MKFDFELSRVDYMILEVRIMDSLLNIAMISGGRELRGKSNSPKKVRLSSCL